MRPVRGVAAMGHVRRHGVRVNVTEIVSAHEHSMRRHAKIKAKVLRRLAVLQNGQHHHAFGPSPERRRIQFDRVGTVGSLCRANGRLLSRGQARYNAHGEVEADDLLTQPLGHGIGVDMVGAWLWEAYRNAETPISFSFARMLVYEARKIAVRRQHVEFLREFFVEVLDRLSYAPSPV